ncbi:hypothetical protein KO489_01360 [Reinekea forsetii]|nr:hypothetical protein [Reinekea forsetii]
MTILLEYLKVSGEIGKFDLDAAIDVIECISGTKALILYAPDCEVFIETKEGTIENSHGMSSETNEVNESYLKTHFSLSSDDISKIRNNPKQWRFQST